MSVDVLTEKIVTTVKEVDTDLVCLSALLTTKMVKQKEIIDSLEREGLHRKVKFIVGCAPVPRDWFQMIEADGYAEGAIGAANFAK
jgi:methanogenic corrinoid protein MtbC1